MIFDHYLQLLFHFRRLAIWIFVSVVTATAGLSTAILYVIPFYTATATVAILPTDAEVTYAKNLGNDTQAGATALMPALHIEYLLSRPVAERVLEKMRAQLDPQEPVEGWQLVVKQTAGETVKFVWKVYSILNSGKFVEPTPYEQALSRLMRSIDLEVVENSFILQIEVTLPQNAQATAVAANALAEAYVERVIEQTAAAAQSLIASIDKEIYIRNQQLIDLQERELRLREEAGILSLEQERQALLNARDLEQQRLLDIKIEREELEARLQSYETDRSGMQRRGTLAMVEEEIALSDSKLSALARREALRQQSVDKINGELAALSKRENPITEIQREIQRVRTEVDGLEQRKTELDLSQSKALSLVRVVNPAVEPVYASFPKVVINTAIAIVASIFVVIFVLIAVDTLPGSVKTSVDLRRLVGHRALGRIPHDIADHLASASEEKMAQLRPRLADVGKKLEPRLGGLGFFDRSTILVTGFGSAREVGASALALSAAIEALGCDIRWRPAKGGDPEDAEAAVRLGIPLAGNDAGAGAVDGSQSAETLTIEYIGPISKRFSWREITERAAPLVCIFGDGTLTEEEITEFCDEAEKRGVPELAFLMTVS